MLTETLDPYVIVEHLIPEPGPIIMTAMMKQLLRFRLSWSRFWYQDMGVFSPSWSKQHQAWVFNDKTCTQLVFLVIVQVGYLGILGPHLEIHFFMDLACVIVWIYGVCHFLFYFIYLTLCFLPLSGFPPAPPWCVSPLPNYPYLLCVYSLCAHGSPCQSICLVSVGLFLCLPFPSPGGMFLAFHPRFPVLFLVCTLFFFCSWISGVLCYLPFVSSTSGIWILWIWFFTKHLLFVQSLVCLSVLCFDPLSVKQRCTEYNQEPIPKCLKPAFFLMGSRGQLYWLKKKSMVCKPMRKLPYYLTWFIPSVNNFLKGLWSQSLVRSLPQYSMMFIF